MSFEPRLTPARPDLAAAHLEGEVEAARFVPGRPHVVGIPILPLTHGPDPEGELASQLLLGESFTIYDTDPATGLAWGQAADGYVGWVPQAGLEREAAAGTPHRVSALFTHVYPEPQFKCRPVEALPFRAEVGVTGEAGDFLELAIGGYAPRQHLAADWPDEPDPVTWSERFLNVAYLWGGRSPAGLDCSALVQLGLQAAGVAARRDADLQMASLGRKLRKGSRLRRGDLVFWTGHVGWMQDETRLLHANIFHMAVASEPLEAAVARIDAAGGGKPLQVRRLG
ncbi:MAG: NlpC/P60 family protein [Pseudomonadota bacterium]